MKRLLQNERHSLSQGGIQGGAPYSYDTTVTMDFRFLKNFPLPGQIPIFAAAYRALIYYYDQQKKYPGEGDANPLYSGSAGTGGDPG